MLEAMNTNVYKVPSIVYYATECMKEGVITFKLCFKALNKLQFN